jgi:hypothetical protein
MKHHICINIINFSMVSYICRLITLRSVLSYVSIIMPICYIFANHFHDLEVVAGINKGFKDSCTLLASIAMF